MVAKSGARKGRSTRKEVRNLASKSLKSKEAGSVKGGASVKGGGFVQQKRADGNANGNVAAKWSLTQGSSS